MNNSDLMSNLVTKLTQQIPGLNVDYDRLTTQLAYPYCSITCVRVAQRNPDRNYSYQAIFTSDFQIIVKTKSSNANGSFAQLVEKDTLITAIKTAISNLFQSIAEGSLVITGFLYLSNFEIPFIDVPEVESEIMISTNLQVVHY